MTHQQPKINYTDQCFKPNSFIYWQGQTYQIKHPDDAETDPLLIWIENIETLELAPVRIEELLLPMNATEQSVPIFAPTLTKLKQELATQYFSPSPSLTTGLPDSLLQKAEAIVAVVEGVAQYLQAKERLALLQNKKMNYTATIKQACTQLKNPVGLTTYYKYRRLYREYDGDRAGIATALRRSTFNQTRMSSAQLHFIDTFILRFYAGKRTIRPRPQLLYHLAQSALERTRNFWLDPDKCPSTGAENVVEELLDTHLPIQIILDNPEKKHWLTPIQLPSRSWFYNYLRWFETQPEQGKEVITARYGKETWEQEYMIFDTFVNRAVRILEYVFADHWLIDLFIVDENTRCRLDRLWLTLLIDAYSRSILGMALLYETPCIESIQSALKHAIWPKVSHREFGINAEWICYGIPQQLSLDNAWAHHSLSLEKLARGISHKGKYNSIDLVFRPPYRGRYGALIERLFGNFSAQLKELLPEAILSGTPKHIQNAARQARLLYQDVNYIIHQLIVKYQHTPHRELGNMTPHQKWLESQQLGYPGQVPPLSQSVDRLFWRRNPETRVLNHTGISVFGLHYWSPELDLAPRKKMNGQPIRYEFSFEPSDISRLAIFRQDDEWVGDVYAKQLRRADNSLRSVSLWERKMAQTLARNRGQASRDWLTFVTEIDELSQTRSTEKKQAMRKAKSRKIKYESSSNVEQLEMAINQISENTIDQDYTDLLVDFLDQ